MTLCANTARKPVVPWNEMVMKSETITQWHFFKISNYTSVFGLEYLRLINKANLRDLIPATSLVILPKLDVNQWFVSPYDLEIRWMTSKNNRASLLGYIKLCALFQNHQWIQTGVTVRKCSDQNWRFFVPCNLEIWQMTLKTVTFTWYEECFYFGTYIKFMHNSSPSQVGTYAVLVLLLDVVKSHRLL